MSEWQVYEAIEPFGERRADYRAASLCHIIAVANGAKNVELKDFLLSNGEEPGEPDALGFAFAMGAKVVAREPE